MPTHRQRCPERHRHATTSIRALAKALKRDYSNVHADVQALISVGLLDVSKAGVRDVTQETWPLS